MLRRARGRAILGLTTQQIAAGFCVAVFAASGASVAVAAAGDTASPAAQVLCQDLAREAPPRRPASPRHDGRPEPSESDLRACVLGLMRVFAAPSPAVAVASAHRSSAAREERWQQAWRAVQRLARWIARADVRALPAGVPGLRAEFAELEREAREAMMRQGLLGGRYAAALTSGVAAADPGDVAGRVPGGATHGLRSVFAGLATELRPLDLGLGWSAGLGVQAGRQPVLAMVTNAGVAEPIFKNATVVATELRFAKDSRELELSAVSRAGATRISLAPITRAEDGLTRTYAAAVNGRDAWALLFDARLEARWYGRDVWAARLNMRTLDPLLRAAVGIRHDERFHRSGDLQPFNDPTGRVFFGFALHPVRAAGFSAGGAFEFEGALRGANRLPSGYRLAAEGTINLRAVRGRRP